MKDRFAAFGRLDHRGMARKGRFQTLPAAWARGTARSQVFFTPGAKKPEAAT